MMMLLRCDDKQRRGMCRLIPVLLLLLSPPSIPTIDTHTALVILMVIGESRTILTVIESKT
jgi:hypothetical protein